MKTAINPELIRKGDIALFRTTESLFSRIIGRVTHSNYSHIAYCLGGFWVAEYVEGTGGRMYDLRAYERAGRRFDIRQDDQLTDRQRSHATRWAKDNCWMEYESFLNLLLFPFRRITEETPRQMKCSEYVFKCFNDGANIDYFFDYEGLPKEKIVPAHFAEHPRWQKIVLSV